MPDKYQKFTDYEVDIKHIVPDELFLNESYKNSLEILDDILLASLGIHFLHPQVLLIPITRARGYQPLKET